MQGISRLPRVRPSVFVASDASLSRVADEQSVGARSADNAVRSTVITGSSRSRSETPPKRKGLLKASVFKLRAVTFYHSDRSNFSRITDHPPPTVRRNHGVLPLLCSPCSHPDDIASASIGNGHPASPSTVELSLSHGSKPDDRSGPARSERPRTVDNK